MIADRGDGAREKIAILSRSMLSAGISFIEGAREISGLRFVARLENDPDILPFVGIDSETDALPLGKVRDLWSSEALQALEPDIVRAEAWAREFGKTHCENLVRRFG